MDIAKEYEERLLRIGKDAIGKVLEVYKGKTRKGAQLKRLLDLQGVVQTLECLLLERTKVAFKLKKDIPLNEIAGRTIFTIEYGKCAGAYGEEQVVYLCFTDGTRHGFVLPEDDE